MPGSLESILSERAWAARQRFEVPVLIAALAVVPVIFIEDRASSTLLLGIAYWANWLIWGIFLAEYVVVVGLTDRRAAYSRKAWLDLFIIVTSFPLLPGLLGATRLFRLARLGRVLRLLRLARLAAVVTRGGVATRVIFRKRGLGYIVVLTALITMGIGGVFAILEDAPVGDSLWWAVVTMTTVGYGDMFPVTAAGRLAAALLMLIGIGFVAMVTATIAASFVESDTSTESEALQRIDSRLDDLEQLVRSLASRPPDAADPSRD